MRYKVLQSLALSLLVCFLLGGFSAAEYGTVVADYVNVRSGPGFSYSVIDCLSRGTSVTVTDPSNPSWYAVSYNGRSGYMAAEYLLIASEANADGSFSVAMTAEEYDAYVASLPPSPSPTPLPSATPETEALLSSTPVPSATSFPDAAVTATPAPSPTPASTPYPTATPGTAPASETTSEPGATPSPEPSTSPIGSSEPYSAKISGDYVRLRSGPGTTYTILGMYNKGTIATVTGTSGDWVACTVNNRSGYIFSRYITSDTLITKNEGTEIESLTSPAASPSGSSPDSLAEESQIPSEPKDGYVCGNNVRFRQGPSLDAQILSELCYGNAVTILSSSGEWTSVSVNGQNGYISTRYLKEGTLSSSAASSDSTLSESSSSTATGSDIVSYAMGFLGSRYLYGGQDPSTGFDCSGFVWYVYRHFGYPLNRVAADQAKNGTFVNVSDLQPGDILCFYSNGSIGHSGIYIGDDKFIHAASSNTGVIVTQLSGYYSSRGYEARRIIN